MQQISIDGNKNIFFIFDFYDRKKKIITEIQKNMEVHLFYNYEKRISKQMFLLTFYNYGDTI